MEKTEHPNYAQLETNTPSGSSWGVFGDPDRGTANFAGATEVREAAAAVVRGEVFNLDYSLSAFDPPMARARRAPEHEILSAHSESRDDVLHEFFLQATSQVDGLRHRRASGHGFYDGVDDDAIQAGAPALGVQAWAERPIVGRGILLDIAGLLSDEGAPLDHRAGPVLEVDHLERACARQDVSVRSGDIVMVHTGWSSWFIGSGNEIRDEVRSGRRATGFRQSRDLARWIWDHKVATFATDTFAVEVLPVVEDSDFLETAPEDSGMMHQELIAKLGVPLGELWNLESLLADSEQTGRWDAMCIIKPLNLVGGVGSPPNATAIR
ncbi:Putative cyclase [Brevibacterium siliguriense]|uniref:Putative cyclase n=1 Tax=Brevibacterium siliguriense TaxID=1136497 RepID=A0A1H1W520_9MICO|nr:cyclase family protein [Brevibacterium siliguriense]SDS91606.1 Putative cyclase [Brevibacterium siliguriense]